MDYNSSMQYRNFHDIARFIVHLYLRNLGNHEALEKLEQIKNYFYRLTFVSPVSTLCETGTSIDCDSVTY